MAKKLSKLTSAILETADDMRSVGLMSEETYRKITVRHLRVSTVWGLFKP